LVVLSAKNAFSLRKRAEQLFEFVEQLAHAGFRQKSRFEIARRLTSKVSSTHARSLPKINQSIQHVKRGFRIVVTESGWCFRIQ